MKKFHKLVYLFALTALLPAASSAKELTPAQAFERVSSDKASYKMKKAPRQADAQLVHTFSTNAGTPMLYVFNRADNNGYIVAAADDLFPAVLGYGDRGAFKPGEVPAAMNWFLDEMSREMEYALANSPELLANRAEAADSREPVEPLLKSKWDQGDPYNLYSPALELINTSTGQPTGETIPTVTGCVATSMAQVMYYHKWPDVGVGSNKYNWTTYSDVLAKELSCDFSQIHFDWDNMLDRYTTDASGRPTWTDAQAKAVAELMYACGISVNMLYNMEAAGGSGATSRDQDAALVNNFKYSRSIRYKYRNFCTSAEFEDIIYDNLKQGLPVLYNGRSSAGGHSFVCDGYAGDHYFHFNWGWSGISDGYFYLARLNPEAVGAGGSTGGFNSSQGISYNIRPVRDGIDTGEAELPYFNCVGSFDYDRRSDSKSNTGEIMTYTYFKVNNPIDNYNAGIWNMSSSTFNGYVGVGVINAKGGQPQFVPGVEAKNIETGKGLTSLPAYLEEFGEGVYYIVPAYYNTVDDEIDYIPVANGSRSFVTMTVDAQGNRSFANENFEEEAAEAPELVVNCFNHTGELSTNIPTSFLVSMTNHSPVKDYYGGLTMVFKLASGRVLTTMPLGSFNVPAGLTIPNTFNVTLDVMKRDYKVSFRDAYGRDLPGEFDLNIAKTGTALSTQLRVAMFSPTEVLPGETVESTTMQIGNYGSTVVSKPKFTLKFTNMETGSEYQASVTYSQLDMAAQTMYNLVITNFKYTMPEGEYNLVVCWDAPKADGSGTVTTPISYPIMLRVGYPVESVSLPDDEFTVEEGAQKKLEVSLLPQNATFRMLSWVSSDPEVATVDNEGNVKGVKTGQAYISAASYNGLVANKLINVVESCGVAEITEYGEDVNAVYSPTGILILSTPDPEQIDALPGGIYIFKTETGSKKVIKR